MRLPERRRALKWGAFATVAVILNVSPWIYRMLMGSLDPSYHPDYQIKPWSTGNHQGIRGAKCVGRIWINRSLPIDWTGFKRQRVSLNRVAEILRETQSQYPTLRIATASWHHDTGDPITFDVVMLRGASEGEPQQIVRYLDDTSRLPDCPPDFVNDECIRFSLGRFEQPSYPKITPHAGEDLFVMTKTDQTWWPQSSGTSHPGPLTAR